MNNNNEETQAEEISTRMEVRKEKAGKKRKICQNILRLLILLLLLGLVYYGYEKFRPRARYEMDMNALEGFLPGRSEEEIQEELNRIIDESRFAVAINTQITYKDGKVDVRIENVPANNYWMQVDIWLYPDADSTENGELFYQSGVIKQQQYIEKAEAGTEQPAGYYNGLAVFHALTPNEDLEAIEEVGQTAMNIVILVKE